MENQLVDSDEEMAYWRDRVLNYEDGPEVLAHLMAVAQGERHVNSVDHAYPLAPLFPASEAQMGGGPMGVAMPVPPPAALRQPINQQPINQQGIQQPNHQQPVVQQPTIQQQAVQQPGHGDRSCPVQGCNSLGGNNRLDHLWDHLAEVHGYERAANEYSVSETHLKRKTAFALKELFIRDARKLAWMRACLFALETAIRKLDNSYVSCHGLTLASPCSIPHANASKKQEVIAMLQHVRGQMSQTGTLYGQAGEGTWDEVYADLVSIYQLDQDDQDAIIRQAEGYFGDLRSSMVDDMRHQVSPADVVRTHQLVLKQGASLPPK